MSILTKYKFSNLCLLLTWNPRVFLASMNSELWIKSNLWQFWLDTRLSNSSSLCLLVSHDALITVCVLLLISSFSSCMSNFSLLINSFSWRSLHINVKMSQSSSSRFSFFILCSCSNRNELLMEYEKRVKVVLLQAHPSIDELMTWKFNYFFN